MTITSRIDIFAENLDSSLSVWNKVK